MASRAKNKPVTSPQIYWIAGALLVALLSIFFRTYPLWLNPRIEATEKARLLIYSGMRKSLEKSMAASLAGQSPENRARAESKALKKLVEKDREKIHSRVQELSNKIIQGEKISKKPFFLMEVDPYYYYTLTKDLLQKKPSIPAPTRGRSYLNTRTLTPEGAWYPWDLHPYTGAWLYRAITLFAPQASLMMTMAWIPVIISILLVLSFFGVWRYIFRGDALSGVVAGCYLLLCPMYLNRSVVGWYDTDSYNLLFPLLTASFLFKALSTEASYKKSWMWALAAIIATASHALFWRGWLLPFIGFCVCLLISTGLHFNKKNITTLALFCLSPLLFVPLFWGKTELTNIATDVGVFIRDFSGNHFSVWPDVFVTVGELRPSSLGKLVEFLGGPVVFYISLIGIASAVFKKSKPAAPTALIVCYFFIAMLCGIKVERFILLSIVPTALGLGWALEKLSEALRNNKRTALATRFTLRLIICGIIMTSILMVAHVSAMTKRSIYNTTWDRAMSYLRTQTPQDAIVATWWSPGHFLTSMGERKVVFDGSTQNTPQAYWVARLFMEKSERRALGILRMLNLSGNKAQELLESDEYSVSDAVNLLLEILPMPRSVAEKRLATELSAEETSKLLDLTHGSGTLPSSYIFLYEDMIRQVMAMEYIGNWDFKKAERFAEGLKKNPSKNQSRLLNRSSKEHAHFLWSMTDGPYYEQPETYESSRSGSVVRFANNLKVDLDSLEATLPPQILGGGKPGSIYFAKDGKLIRKNSSAPDLDVSVLLIDDKTRGLSAVIADDRLIESMGFRLYYLGDKTLKYTKFKHIEDDPTTQTRLLLFEVDWRSYSSAA